MTVRHTINNETWYHPDGIASCPQIIIRSVGPGEKISSLQMPSCANKRGYHGHIEDVLTEDDFRSQGLATKVILEAIAYAKKLNYYKLLLTCGPELIGFYKQEQFGFALMADDPIGFENFLKENPFGIREITMRLDL